MTDRPLTYPQGFDSLVEQWQVRRGRLNFAMGEALPQPDTDLAGLVGAVVQPPPPQDPGASPHARKLQALAQEFQGQSELALLNALLVAHLRKRRQPRHTAALFRRIWVEHGGFLCGTLSTRWLISSIITFADHGETEAQRRLGQSLNMLFSMMKLYEFERLHSGHAPDEPFAVQRSRPALPLGMTDFSLASGGLDVNLLAPIWLDAQKEPVCGPLACHLLDRLNADDGTLFRRLALMRESRKHRRRRPQKAAAAQDDGQQP